MLRRSSGTNRIDGSDMQVTRRRRPASRGRVGVLAGTSQRLRIVVVAAVAVGVLAAAGVTYASTQGFGNNEVGTQ